MPEVTLSPSTSESMTASKPRVLIIFGSESRSTERLIRRAVKNWLAKDPKLQEPDVMTGNAWVEKFGTLESIPESYDVLLVATCSYGCGEAPVNISMFFDKIMEEAEQGEVSRKLLGVQHAVMGCGSTFYETFQNCPRLHDKFLGENGSRRLVMRAEIDDSVEEEKWEQAHYLRWVDQVFECLQNLPPASDPPVCDWDQPQGKITETMSLSTSCPPGLGPELVAAAGTLIGASVAAAYYFDLMHEQGLVGALRDLLSSRASLF